ncbi:calmodulin-binding-domain-containing protein [Polychytrium aggregatum]|uniref:calmodulin-binding-domain-containing protein n=1 Tax=Polychytrium aggregatum TaxID=110093 RepID=UPI0022FE1F60|nr:calmodulin-binding-domain-containing protein [Polychytrium aggregatum]KAI9204738.1 calmodulin-binding-domain-containing protein [Polychytrium aggregatum]
MDAKQIKRRQMSGHQMSSLLHPTHGLRDELIRRGETPKDHGRINYHRIKEMERANHEKKQQEQVPPPQPFKLKKFDAVKAKLDTRRSSAPGSPTASGTPESSRPSTAASSSTTASQKNFIRINSLRAKNMTPSPSPTVEPVAPDRKLRLGQVPKYLIERKMVWADQELQRLESLKKEEVPEGMIQISDFQRTETLRHLQRRKQSLVAELNNLPVILETLRMKKKKQEIETELEETDHAIDTFSKPKVFVRRSDTDEAIDVTAAGTSASTAEKENTGRDPSYGDLIHGAVGTWSGYEGRTVIPKQPEATTRLGGKPKLGPSKSMPVMKHRFA